jgi:hypothetical protein
MNEVMDEISTRVKSIHDKNKKMNKTKLRHNYIKLLWLVYFLTGLSYKDIS